MTAKEEALMLLNCMPKVNSVNTYGSGFFVQNDKLREKKTRDMIISVDNVPLWHKKNYLLNPEIYKGASIKTMSDLNNNFNFPSGITCFFTDYEGVEYKLMVIDKRLLYHDLATWQHFSLAGRFQKETEILVDNSNGVLKDLMQVNYENAFKTALLLNPQLKSKNDLYKTIAGLSYLGDLRVRLHFENHNKIDNIVSGSYKFFENNYGKYLYCDLSQNGNVLPEALYDFLIKNLSYNDFLNPDKVSLAIKKYFEKIDLISSFQLMIRCNQTVGLNKTVQTVVGKAKKGLVKSLK